MLLTEWVETEGRGAMTRIVRKSIELHPDYNPRLPHDEQTSLGVTYKTVHGAGKRGLPVTNTKAAWKIVEAVAALSGYVACSIDEISRPELHAKPARKAAKRAPKRKRPK
jgi:hypothetical protein